MIQLDALILDFEFEEDRALDRRKSLSKKIAINVAR